MMRSPAQAQPGELDDQQRTTVAADGSFSTSPGKNQSGIAISIEPLFIRDTPITSGNSKSFDTDSKARLVTNERVLSRPAILIDQESQNADTFEYQTNLPRNTYVKTSGEYIDIFESPTSRYLGSLQNRPAYDSNKQAIPTTLEVRDSRIIQKALVNQKNVAYPMAMAAPSWNYVFDYTFYDRNSGKRWLDVVPLLQRCFNCVFPVYNAPAAFPRVGDRIDLRAQALGGIVTVPAPVRVTSVGRNYFSFISLEGHFDGEGSTVAFSWYAPTVDDSGPLHFYVRAGVVNDLALPLRYANSITAGDSWNTFCQKVGEGLRFMPMDQRMCSTPGPAINDGRPPLS